MFEMGTVLITPINNTVREGEYIALQPGNEFYDITMSIVNSGYHYMVNADGNIPNPYQRANSYFASLYPMYVAFVKNSNNTYGTVKRLIYSNVDNILGEASIISYLASDRTDINYNGIPVGNNIIVNNYSISRYYSDFNVDFFDTEQEAREALQEYFIKYPITYSATNGTVSGQSEASINETVIATGIPNENYAITDPNTQIAVTCNGVPVNYTWDASTGHITFIMPDPNN